jgi:flagellar hook-associated protein FlgK
MTLDQLSAQKNILLNRVNELTAVKKKLFSNVDIESAMSDLEKSITKEIANSFSQINQLVKQIQQLKKS